MVSVVQETADKMRDDSREALNYLSAQVVALNSQNIVGGSNIVKKAKERLELHQQKKEFGTNYIKTGFPELDEVIYGLEPGNELLTVAGRPNQGKTWILLKMLVEAWKQGKRVAMYSGEMNDMQIGYRFDTLLANFSNKALVIGENVSGYEDFIDKTQKNMLPFYVFTPKNFGGRATVSSIQSMITACKADIIGIDQYSLMDDETYTQPAPAAPRHLRRLFRPLRRPSRHAGQSGSARRGFDRARHPVGRAASRFRGRRRRLPL